MAATVTLEKVDALDYQHAFGDDKPATRFAVLVNGKVVGYVSSRSEESRAKTGTRVAGRLLGYRRSFVGHLATNRNVNMPTVRNSDVWESTRKRAVDKLVDRHLELARER